MTKVILDIGSCHNGKLEYAKEAIDLAAEVGAYAIKFQLFRNPPQTPGNGNIELPRDWWSILVAQAAIKDIKIFASCFDEEAIELLHKWRIPMVKLAYSQNFNLKLIKKAKQLGMEIWASGDHENYPNYADKKFFCWPEYPYKKYHAEIMHESQKVWDGLSYHRVWPFEVDCLKKFDLLEVHLTLDHDDIDCPDHWFALSPKELKEMMKCLQSA